MPDAPANAWTGRHLLSWLRAHPQWLDRPVHLLLMTGGEEDAYLTTAEEDRFNPGDPNVISLIADGPDAAVAPPSPAVDREGLEKVLQASAWEHMQVSGTPLWPRRMAEDLISAGWVRGPVEQQDGAGLIAAERRRVVTEKGRTPEHDDRHVHGELLDAARCYANHGRTWFPEFTHKYGTDAEAMCDQGWPWWTGDEPEGWKPSSGAIPNLVKAGQFIAAEIDRLQRAGRGDLS